MIGHAPAAPAPTDGQLASPAAHYRYQPNEIVVDGTMARAVGTGTVNGGSPSPVQCAFAYDACDKANARLGDNDSLRDVPRRDLPHKPHMAALSPCQPEQQP